ALVFSCLIVHDAAAPGIYTRSLHDALPICLAYAGSAARRPWFWLALVPQLPGLTPPGPWPGRRRARGRAAAWCALRAAARPRARDRKSTRLNSSHVKISYAVLCLKKKRTPA